MSKSSHARRNASPEKSGKGFSGDQSDLFDTLEARSPLDTTSIDLDIGPELIGAVNTAIRLAKQNGLSRDRIVDGMNKLLPDLPKPLTKRQLDCWTAQSVEYSEFPARYLPALCAVTGCDMPLRVLAQALQFDIVDARERMIKELGDAEVKAAMHRRNARELRESLIRGGE